ncbi:MAG: hypothetical protein GDA54_05160 [Alphaproteobacteria bacterium GM7ARS4]|nr:hypothetical protein [Alphaproteobacteria bacterium GM7ARS4]
MLSRQHQHAIEARQYALQALYHILVGDNDDAMADAIWIERFKEDFMEDAHDETCRFFTTLCQGVMTCYGQMLASWQTFMHPRRPWRTLPVVIRAVLLLSMWEWCYAYEGGTRPTRPMNEREFIRAYLYLADGFCHGKDVSFINALLHKIVHGEGISV